MNIENLSPELLEKAEACNTAEELFALAKDEGIELSDEDIAAISGGARLPRGGKKNRKGGWGSDEESDED